MARVASGESETIAGAREAALGAWRRCAAAKPDAAFSAALDAARTLAEGISDRERGVACHAAYGPGCDGECEATARKIVDALARVEEANRAEVAANVKAHRILDDAIKGGLMERVKAAEAREAEAREALAEVTRRAALPITPHVTGMPDTQETVRDAIAECARLVVEHVTEPARAALAALPVPDNDLRARDRGEPKRAAARERKARELEALVPSPFAGKRRRVRRLWEG